MTGLAAVLHALASGAGRARDLLARWARQVGGGPDPVDEHHAEARSLWLGQGPFEQSAPFRRLREASKVDWPPTTAIEHECTTVPAKPFEVVDDDDLVLNLMSFLGEAYPEGQRDYSGEIRDRAEVLVREMKRDGFVLARTPYVAPTDRAPARPVALAAVGGRHHLAGDSAAPVAGSPRLDPVDEQRVTPTVAYLIASLYPVGHNADAIDVDARAVVDHMRTEGLVLARRTS